MNSWDVQTDYYLRSYQIPSCFHQDPELREVVARLARHIEDAGLENELLESPETEALEVAVIRRLRQLTAGSLPG